MTTTNLSTLAPLNLPPWFNRYNSKPSATGNWVVGIKLPASERSVLLSTQKAWAELWVTMPRGHPSDIGRTRWSRLRREYAETRNPKLLAEIGEIGDHGSVLIAKLREQKHAVHKAARELAHLRGCRPIYAHVFSLAARIVADRLKVDNEREKSFAKETTMDFAPSDSLWGLANLAAYYQGEADQYGGEPVGNELYLACPANALGDLWAGIVKEGRK